MQNVGSFSQHHRRNIPSHDYRRTMCDEKVYWKWGSWSCDRNGMSGSFEVGFFLRGTCCSVAQQTRGMPGPIKDGMHWPGLDKSFPKVVTLQTKRENENTQLRSTLFSRSSKRHEWDEIVAKFESPMIYFLKFHSRKYHSWWYEG